MTDHSADNIGVGLIGVGRHGSRYLVHLTSDVPGVSVAALCRKRVNEHFDVHHSDFPVYGDYRALINDSRVHAVVVVTAPTLCHDICLSSVQAGKPLLIEKPLATTGKDARAMVAAAERSGVMLMTAQTMRFDPTILLAKAQLPMVGRLQQSRLISHIEWDVTQVTRTATPLGVMLELGVHLLDLVRFLTGEEVVEAACTMDRLVGNASETAARAQLLTGKGIRCDLDIARTESGRLGRMEWVGSEGTIIADWIQRRVVLRLKGEDPHVWTVEPKPTIVSVLRSFVHAIRTQTSPPVTGVDGCRAVELADACYQSAARGGVPMRLD